MRYIIEIRLETKSRSYKIDASSEAEAIERLKLRLPPHQREAFEIDSISIDPASLSYDEPFGIYCD